MFLEILFFFSKNITLTNQMSVLILNSDHNIISIDLCLLIQPTDCLNLLTHKIPLFYQFLSNLISAIHVE